jgi:hypothetical protein
VGREELYAFIACIDKYSDKFFTFSKNLSLKKEHKKKSLIMRAFICLALLILTANAAKMHKTGYVSAAHINELRKGNTWASLIMELAEMHML